MITTEVLCFAKRDLCVPDGVPGPTKSFARAVHSCTVTLCCVAPALALLALSEAEGSEAEGGTSLPCLP